MQEARTGELVTIRNQLQTHTCPLERRNKMMKKNTLSNGISHLRFVLFDVFQKFFRDHDAVNEICHNGDGIRHSDRI